MKRAALLLAGLAACGEPIDEWTAPIFEGSRFSRLERDAAVLRGVRFLEELAADEKHFDENADEFIWAFAINTWERQTHVLPVSHQVYLDINQDGADDYVILNRDVSFAGASDGRQLTWALDLSSGAAGAFFYAEHSTNTGNTVLYVCGEQVGLTGSDMLATNVDVDVYAQDFYFGGPGDLIEGLTVTPLGEQYVATAIEDLAPKARTNMEVEDFGAFEGNTPELGIMLVTNGDRGNGARGGATEWSEAKLFFVKSWRHRHSE